MWMTEEIHHINLRGVNAFLVKTAQQYILIDTGTGAQWQTLDLELRACGCLPGMLSLVVVTHGDVDHAGNCAALQAQYQAKIAIHAADADMVIHGIPVRHRTEKMLAAVLLWLGARLQKQTPFDTFQPDLLLHDGQTLDEYGLAATVVHTPGHTAGSIALATMTGHVFAGDTISNRIKPGIAPFAQDFQAVRSSLLILQQLNGTTYYPGHGNPLSFEALASMPGATP
jgi:glyoxylase-like metal-dependent hydrolase (beta-lactamase superfamily II)